MARGITQEQVNAAIDQLLLNGERPTIERVRASLGTGSPNTLTRMLDIWWQGLGERLTMQRRSAAVPDAPAAVVDAASALWEAALAAAGEVAEQSLGQARDALDAERQTLDHERQALATTLEAAKHAQARAEQGQRESETRLGDLQRLVDQQSAQIGDLQQRVSAANSEVTTLMAQLQRVEAARTQAHEQAVLDRRDLEASHRASQDRWMTEVDRLRQENARLTRELASSENNAREALREANSRVATLSGHVNDLESREAAAAARASALESQLERMHDQLRTRLKAPVPTRRQQKAPRKVKE